MPMSHLNELIERLRANVDAGMPDVADRPMKVPAASYADAQQYQPYRAPTYLDSPPPSDPS